MFRRVFATFKEMMSQTNLYKHKVHCFWVWNCSYAVHTSTRYRE